MNLLAFVTNELPIVLAIFSVVAGAGVVVCQKLELGTLASMLLGLTSGVAAIASIAAYVNFMDYLDRRRRRLDQSSRNCQQIVDQDESGTKN